MKKEEILKQKAQKVFDNKESYSFFKGENALDSETLQELANKEIQRDELNRYLSLIKLSKDIKLDFDYLCNNHEKIALSKKLSLLKEFKSKQRVKFALILINSNKYDYSDIEKILNELTLKECQKGLDCKTKEEILKKISDKKTAYIDIIEKLNDINLKDCIKQIIIKNLNKWYCSHSDIKRIYGIIKEYTLEEKKVIFTAYLMHGCYDNSNNSITKELELFGVSYTEDEVDAIYKHRKWDAMLELGASSKVVDEYIHYLICENSCYHGGWLKKISPKIFKMVSKKMMYSIMDICHRTHSDGIYELISEVTDPDIINYFISLYEKQYFLDLYEKHEGGYLLKMVLDLAIRIKSKEKINFFFTKLTGYFLSTELFLKVKNYLEKDSIDKTILTLIKNRENFKKYLDILGSEYDYWYDKAILLYIEEDHSYSYSYSITNCVVDGKNSDDVLYKLRKYLIKNKKYREINELKFKLSDKEKQTLLSNMLASDNIGYYISEITELSNSLNKKIDEEIIIKNIKGGVEFIELNPTDKVLKTAINSSYYRIESKFKILKLDKEMKLMSNFCKQYILTLKESKDDKDIINIAFELKKMGAPKDFREEVRTIFIDWGEINLAQKI